MLAFYTTIKEFYPAIGENAKMRIFEQATTVDLVMMVKTWILDGHKVDRLESIEIEFPATWWDHWKLEHGPKWLVKRWPVVYKSQQVTKAIHQHYVCPHINLKDESYPHIAWMYENSGQKRRNNATS